MTEDGFERTAMHVEEVPAYAARSSGALRPWVTPEKRAMGELLVTFPWVVFCTWQFRHRIGEEGALREVRTWLALLRFAWRQEVGWMIGVEQELGDEHPHVHGLVCGPRLVEVETLYRGKAHEKTVPLIEPFWLAWREAHGGGEFRIIVAGERKSKRLASFYCAKYATKRGAIEFSANLEKFRGTVPLDQLEQFTLYPE